MRRAAGQEALALAAGAEPIGRKARGAGATGRAWRELDLDALSRNARALEKALAPGCRLMAVVKGEAYGHGAGPVALRLQGDGITDFAVACLDEGIRLREEGVRGQILILGYTPPGEAELLGRWRLTQTVADEAHGAALAARGIPIQVHLALDTGMRRLGIPAGDHRAIARMYRLPSLRIRGVFSHLCTADSPAAEDLAFAKRQLERFFRTLRWMRETGLDPGDSHIQASGALSNLPPQPCVLARVGLALYGASGGSAPALELSPVLSLRARVASVRTLAPGEGAGYGLAYRPTSRRRIAAVTIGYADGQPRALAQGGGQVVISGRRCPIVGQMCMDQLLADVTEAPQVVPGSVATVIGRSGGEEIRAEEVADRCGTIPNEILARLGPRLPVVVRSR